MKLGSRLNLAASIVWILTGKPWAGQRGGRFRERGIERAFACGYVWTMKLRYFIAASVARVPMPGFALDWMARPAADPKP